MVGILFFIYTLYSKNIKIGKHFYIYFNLDIKNRFWFCFPLNLNLYSFYNRDVILVESHIQHQNRGLSRNFKKVNLTMSIVCKKLGLFFFFFITAKLISFFCSYPLCHSLLASCKTIIWIRTVCSICTFTCKKINFSAISKNQIS